MDDEILYSKDDASHPSFFGNKFLAKKCYKDYDINEV